MDLSVQLTELRENLEALKSNIIQDVERKFASATERLVQEIVRQQEAKEIENGRVKLKYRPTESREFRPDELRRKVFCVRNSVLTDLFEMSHLKSVYNICTIAFLALILHTVLYYAVKHETLKVDLDIFLWSVGQPITVLLTCLIMNLSILMLVYPAFCYWASKRFTVSPRDQYWLDGKFLVLYIAYLILFVALPPTVILKYNVPCISTMIILSENVRLILKIYAFVYENIPRACSHKPHQDGDHPETLPYPEFQNLVYFLFVPTIIYRDSYPRTSRIRWKRVAWHFVEVFSCIFGTYVAFNRCCVDLFKDTGRVPFEPVRLFFILSGYMVLGGGAMLLMFYGIIHAWMNAFAEMLRFGDRLFYKDWWNSTSFSEYYRKWNMVIHDWLYIYVYRELYIATKGQRVWPMLSVFLLSAVVHEYIIAMSFRFLYPVLFHFFIGIGVSLIFVSRSKTSAGWNIFLWIMLFSGWGLMLVLYALEWFSRVNCPPHPNPTMDFFIPRSWTCKLFR